MNLEWGKLAIELVVAVSGGALGFVALATIRERRGQMRAEAGKTAADGTAAILSAAAEGLKSQFALVPQLTERIKGLEAKDEARDREIDQLRADHAAALERIRADHETALAEMRGKWETAESRAATLEAELALVYRWIDEVLGWAHQALDLIRRLDGDMPPPPEPPARRHGDGAVHARLAGGQPPTGPDGPAPPAVPPAVAPGPVVAPFPRPPVGFTLPRQIRGHVTWPVALPGITFPAAAYPAPLTA